jgi:hypothetical protein
MLTTSSSIVASALGFGGTSNIGWVFPMCTLANGRASRSSIGGT